MNATVIAKSAIKPDNPPGQSKLNLVFMNIFSYK